MQFQVITQVLRESSLLVVAVPVALVMVIRLVAVVAVDIRLQVP